MDITGSDRFALEAFSLAFCIQRILHTLVLRWMEVFGTPHAKREVS